MDKFDQFVNDLQEKIFDEAREAYGEKGFDRWRNPRHNGRMDAADYVLARFTSEEQETIRAAVQKAADAVECWLRDGIDKAMTQYNVKNGAD